MKVNKEWIGWHRKRVKDFMYSKKEKERKRCIPFYTGIKGKELIDKALKEYYEREKNRK
jgi:hypothetical protein